MSRTEKTTPALMWEALASKYFIGFRMEVDLKRDPQGHVILDDAGHPIPIKVGKNVNELQEAIDDGVLDGLMEECANTLHSGDKKAAFDAFAKRLQSKAYHQRHSDRKESSEWKHDQIMLTTLEKWLAANRPNSTGASSSASSVLPQWAYGPEEIDQITSAAQLQKVINSIADVCSNKAGAGVYSQRLGDNYLEVAKQNRAYARQRKAELEAKERIDEVDPDLLKKLTKGGTVKLTDEQAAALVKLLSNR